MNRERGIRMTITGLYKDRTPAKMATEMVQNAFDEVMQNPDPSQREITYRGGYDNSLSEQLGLPKGTELPTIEIADTGRGMTPEQLGTVFTDVYESGKTGEVDAAGGWGVAKTSFQLGGKYFRAVSTTKGKNGQLERHVIEGTPEELIAGVPIKSEPIENEKPPTLMERLHRLGGTEPVAPSAHTGLSVKVWLAPKQYNWQAASNFKKAAESTPAQVRFKMSEHGYTKPAEVEKIPVEKLGDATSEGANISLASGPTGKQPASYVPIRVMNHGLLQFEWTYYIGDATPGMPEFITADVKPTVRPGDPAYPFTQSREELTRQAEDSVKDFLNAKLMERLRAQRVEALTKDWNAIDQMPLTSGDAISIYDEGGAFQPEQTLTSPYWQNYLQSVSKIQDWFLRNYAKSRSVGHLGVFFPLHDVEGANKSVVFGINIPKPDGSEEAIFLNPLGTGARDIIFPERPPLKTATAMARHQFNTIVHEFAHNEVRAHGVSFEGVMAEINALIPPEVESSFVGDLARAIAGENRSPNEQPHPEYEAAVQRYLETRRQASRDPESLGGTGVTSAERGQRPIEQREPAEDERGLRGNRERPEPAVSRAVKGLVDQELKPAFAKAAEVFKELRDVITPRAGVPVKTLDTVQGRLGQRERHIFDLDNQLDKAEKAVDKLPQDQQVAFVDQFKTGGTQATPELQQIANSIAAIDEATYMRVIEAQVRRLGKGAQKLWKELSAGEKAALAHNSTQFAADAEEALEQEDISKEEKRAMQIRLELANGILDYKENHYRVLWKVIPGKEAGDEGTERGLGSALGKRRPFQGSKGFLKQSTLADMSEGLERGGEPYSYNFITMFKRTQADAERYITAQDIWNDAKEQGARVFVKRGANPSDNFSKVENDRIGNVSFKAASGEGQIQAGEWYLRDDYAKLLNNFLSSGWIDKSPAVRGIMTAKNQLTMYRLGFSPFHALVETVSGMASEVGRGLGELDRSLRGGGIQSAGHGLLDLLGAVGAPYTRTRLGTSAIRYVTNKAEFLRTQRGQDFARQYPEADAMLDRMFASGAKLGLHPDEALHSIGKLKAAWANADWNNNPLGASARLLFHSPGAINQQVMKPLFNYFIPRIKLGSFLREYSQALVDRQEDLASGQMTEGELGRKTWDSIEDVFGQVNWDKFFWHQNTKVATQILFRAAQWAAGNVRFVKNATAGQAKEFAQSAGYINAKVHGREYSGYKSTRAVPRLNPDMGKLLGLLMVASAANLALQYALTKEGPKSPADFFAARTGKLDVHGKPIRVITSAIVLTDAVALKAHGAGRYVAGKISDLVGGMWDVITNSDFQHNMIHNPDDAWWEPKSLWQDAKHVVGSPIGVSQFEQLRQSGATATEAGLGAAGFKPAPPRLEWTKAETAAYDLLAAKRGPKSPEEQQEIADYFQRRTAGELSLSERRAQLKNTGKSFLTKTMQSLVQDGATLSELKGIEDKASPEERSQIHLIMLHAQRNDLRRRIGLPSVQ